MTSERLNEILSTNFNSLYEKRESEFGSEGMRILERVLINNVLNSKRSAMNIIYKRTGEKTATNQLFEEIMPEIQGNLARSIFHMAIRREPAPVPPVTFPPRAIASTSGTATAGIKQSPNRQTAAQSQFAHVPQSPMAKVAAGSPGGVSKQTTRVAGKKVGRNDPCPCGSGRNISIAAESNRRVGEA